MRLEFEPDAAVFPAVESDVLNEGEATSSPYFELLLKTGISAAQSGERDRARELLVQATDLNAQSEDAWMWLASISDYPEELLAFLNKVLEINPANDRAGEWRSATRSLLAKTFFQRGILAHEKGDSEMAKKCIEQSLAHDAKYEQAWLLKATLATDDEQKLESLGKVLELNPENDEAHTAIEAVKSARSHMAFGQAKGAAATGDRAKAVEIVDEFLRNFPNSVEAWTLKSHLSESVAEKVEALEKALEIDPDNAAARSGLSFLALTFGTTAETAEVKAPEPVEVADSGDAVEAAQVEEKSAEVDSENEFTAFTENSASSPDVFHESAFTENPEIFESTENFVAEHEIAGSPSEVSESIKAISDPYLVSDHPDASEQQIELVSEPESAKSPRTEEPISEMIDSHESSSAVDVNGNPANFEDVGPTGSHWQDVIAGVYESQRSFETDFLDETETQLDTEPEEPWEHDKSTEEIQAFADASSSKEDEGIAFSTQPTAESIYFEETPIREEAEAEDRGENHLEDADAGAFDPWKTIVSGTDSWPAQNEVPILTVSEINTPAAAAAEEAFISLPVDMGAGNAVTESSSGIDAEAKDFTTSDNSHTHSASDDEIDVQKMPVEASSVTTSEPVVFAAQSPSVFCPFCAAKNDVDVTACHACFAPIRPLENSGQAEPQQFVMLSPEPVEVFPTDVQITGTVCPFCAEHNDAQAFECSSCNAALTLSDIESLLSTPRANQEVVQQAVTQMEAEWNLREFDEQELTALAIGHFNLGNSDDGFKYLQEVSRLSPNNVILSGQINSIAIRLDERRRHDERYDAKPKGKTILVVDDSPTVRKLIAGKLEKSGHNVVSAVDGIDALARIDESLPDLILLDIAMPRMDGYEVCKQIRSNPVAKNLPVVMISGKDGFFDKVRGRMAGCTGYVTKPFGPETLMKALETYLLPDEVDAN